MPLKRELMYAVSALVVAVGMAGCGNGESQTTTGSTGGPAGTSNVSGTDPFLLGVIQTVTADSNANEPAAVDSVSATTPENAEPAPIS
jgi:hypothetical protein